VRTRELALFNLAPDSKLRSCDLVRLAVKDVPHGGQVADRAIDMQQKTPRPAQFDIHRANSRLRLDRILCAPGLSDQGRIAARSLESEGRLWRCLSFVLRGYDLIWAGTESEESSMNSVQIEQKSYEMPPRDGFTIAHFLTVADIERSARYYEKVFGARILSLGDGNAPGYLQLANIWMILNVGGGPTPDKPTVTLSVPDPNHINSFMNFRVADIQACYKLWKSRGAEFITEPIPKYGETRCYIRDPDGYIIEVGQSTDLKYG